jgi:hypothetical protein
MLVPLGLVGGQIVVNLGVQGSGEHPPGALAHDRVQVQAQLTRGRIGGDYTQHAAFLPRRRWPAGASRTCHPGRYAALSSPDPIHNFKSYLLYPVPARKLRPQRGPAEPRRVPERQRGVNSGGVTCSFVWWA